LGVAAAAGMCGAEEIPREEIRAKIEQCVNTILATQRDDGAFVLSERHMEEYPLGNTGLAIMALGYARPHLQGEQRGKVYDAIRKGIGYIMQQKPDEKTYSAGFVIGGLFKESPERYKRMIGTYATMLCISQHEKGYEMGEWGYKLRPFPGPQSTATGAIETWGDKSNTQLALLGLYYAERSGFQVPKVVWARAADHYRRAQFADGGWGYKPELRPEPYANMTIASTISLNLCEEMLRSKEHRQCTPPPRSKEIEAGLKWIGDNWESKKVGSDTYGLYALERLGIIMGRANIGGHDWYHEGARTLLRSSRWSSFAGTSDVSTAFGLMFLARGLEPIIINKLERRDTEDWNNDPYDVKHLTEFIEDKYQVPAQWRIVTLEAPKEVIQRAPMLYISGHKALEFNAEEKEKLKAYMKAGGVILGQACCGKKEFDTSFRELVKELCGSELNTIPTTHRIYERMRGTAAKPRVEIATEGEGQGRPLVIYLPHDQCCRWHVGGKGADGAFAVGAGIYFYVTIEVRKMYEDSIRETSPTGEVSAEKPAEKAGAGGFGETP